MEKPAGAPAIKLRCRWLQEGSSGGMLSVGPVDGSRLLYAVPLVLKIPGWLGEGRTCAGEPLWAQGHGSSLVLGGNPARTQRVAGWLLQAPARCVSSSCGWPAPRGAREHGARRVVQLLSQVPSALSFTPAASSACH